MERPMVRRTDHPLRKVRVSFETTRFSPQLLIDAYERLVPTVRRVRRQASRAKASRREIAAVAVKARRGKA
jgi:transcriptional regulator of nitric oxide reductase